MRALCLLLAVLAIRGAGAQSPDSVLIIVNDEVGPEEGTGSKGASRWVAETYAAARKIPSKNIVHTRTRLACCNNSPLAWDSFHISFANFDEQIRKPVKRFLEENGLKEKIKYIVPIYGVPSHLDGPAPNIPVSVDAFLASMYSPAPDRVISANPYYNPLADSTPKRLHEFINPWPFYAVVRLDGPSAKIAAGLVEKAIAAEKSLTKDAGVGYFDWRHINQAADESMKNGYDLCVKAGLRCVLNDQPKNGGMIQDAPDTLWAWGWYSGPATREAYRFVTGAVGAQLTSYTATRIRSPANGAWVPLWLSAGITATWGATGEPYVSGYALGDNLLNHMWNGYNFGESAYIAAPQLNWTMVFIGDPLYTLPFRPAVKIAVQPELTTLAPKQSQRMFTPVTEPVEWSIDPAVGSITDDGVYVAPDEILEPREITVTATLVSDRASKGTAIIRLIPPRKRDSIDRREAKDRVGSP